MLIQNYIARFYAVNVEVIDAHETHIEIYEPGEEDEPIGWFVLLAGAPNCFQYRKLSDLDVAAVRELLD